MAQLLVPEIRNQKKVADFFREFVEINKKESKKVSHRYLALRLNWPISYLSDLMHARKKLTVARAIEFARVVKLNVLETEKFLYLALSEGGNESVESYFSEKLKARTSKGSAAFVRTTTNDKDLFKHIEIGAVFDLLKWAKRPLSSEQIRSLLYTFYDLTDEQIKSIIETLEKHQFIEVKKQQFKILKARMDMDQFEDGTDGGVKIHSQYAKNFVRYSEKPHPPGLYTSGFIEIPKGKFGEVANKLLELRNWLLDLSAEVEKEEKTSLFESLLYQFDINLFVIVDNSFKL